MPRPFSSKPSPWIEQLICNYGSNERSSGSGRLKAYVIGVGQMSQSQTQSCGGPTWFLILSDGVLQIPAVLTAAAWETLQEQEDRECFTSLVNTTVFIQEYQLQFHMSPKQTKCRFFISVGELATTAAGPIKDSTPCCTTSPSVRLKIIKTWRALLGVEDSQQSQCERSELSELLGEWQHDCMHAVLQDIRDKVMEVNSSPSTSNEIPMRNRPDSVAATSWDVDRVENKAAKPFSVPVKCVSLPERLASQRRTSASGLSVASERGSLNASRLLQPSDAAQHCSCVDTSSAAEPGCNAAWNSTLHLGECALQEETVAGLIENDLRPLDNPWDIFPPPCDTSSFSECSQESPLPNSPDAAPVLSSTEFPIDSTEESVQASEPSFLPPYQNLLNPAAAISPTSKQSTCAAQQNLPVSNMEEIMEETHKTANGEKSKSSQEALTTFMQDEAQVSGTPPSWLFESQARGGARDNTRQKHGHHLGASPRKTATCHSNGSSFSYYYQVSGRNLEDLGRFTVDESLKQWAIKILVVPKQTENPHNMSG